MTEPLWRRMIEASDAVLTRPGDLHDPDAAVAAAHIEVVREWLRTEMPEQWCVTGLLFTREIIIARRAAHIATNDEGGPQTPRIGHHAGAMVAASDGEAEAPPATSTSFSP